MKVKYIIALIVVLFLFPGKSFAQPCGSGTPSFTANLTATPNGTWISPPVVRNDTCCGWTGSDVCIKFTVFLHPASMGINFGIASGASPPGALFYSINCGPPIAIGTPICLSGAGPHVLTFCKPGNNTNTYSISAIPAPVVPDSITVRNGCTQTLSVSGFSVPTISWNSINPGAVGAYNSYLSCTSACASVVVTPTGTPPPFVDYVVGGFGQSPCQAAYFQDTVRVYFYTDLLVGINPTLTTICFGSTNALLTATASGGLPPYTFSWSPGSSSATAVTVGPGTYTVQVFDGTGCPPSTATAVVNQYTLPISANAGPNFTVCKSSPNVALNGTVTNATGGAWSGGTGSFTPTSNSVSTTYVPTAAELTAGSVQLYLTTTGNSGCPPDQDTVIVFFQNVPLANAGPNATVCANNSTVNLSGTISGFSSTGQWSTSGNGAFTSTTNLNTTYVPGSTDVSTGSVNIILTSTGNGACPPATSTLQIFITPSPSVNAGTGSSICSTNTVALNGIVSGATTTGTWSTSGNGTFSPFANVLNANYIPGSNDIATGSATLTLTSTNNGNCLVVQDTIIINIKTLATANAGANQLLCSTTGTIGLSGIIGGGTTTGAWTSSGGGPFNPGNTSLNTAYAMSASDISSGSVIFTLTSTNNGPCPAVIDTVKMVITQLATVTAGPNQNLCSNAGIINLTGSVSSSSNTGFWTSSSSGVSGFTPSNTNLTPSYTINATDISAGSVTFTLTSTNNGVCPAVSDTVMVGIQQMALVNAGPNQGLCAVTQTIGLAGTISGVSSTGVWTSSGGNAFNPNNTALNNIYTMSAADIASAFVTFTLSSTNNGPCPVVTDTVKMVITQLATVTAGPNQQLCSSAGVVNLTGAVNSTSNTGFWLGSSNGSSGFNPSNTALSTSYSLNTFDISSGSVTFTLTSTNNGVCPPTSDTVMISIKQLATVNAGPNQSLCSVTQTIGLAGTIGGVSTTGVWASSGGTGFSPTNTTLNGTYNMSAADIASAGVTFTLTSTNNGPCPAVSDTVRMVITQLATVTAGPNQALCSNAGVINLAGAVNSTSNTGFWLGSSSGASGFNPSNTALSTSYSLSATDISNGTVTFTLTSTNNGVCPPTSDTVRMNIKPIAVVNAGPGQALCSNTSSLSLSGTISGGTTSGIWGTSGTGGFNPGSTSLNNTYFVSVADVAAGVINFTLTSAPNTPCPIVTDTMQVYITPMPIVSAGPNQFICSTTTTLSLNGSVTGGGSTGAWSSSGGGVYTPTNSALNPVYSITPSDASNGSVLFTLSSAGTGPCPIVSDTVLVKIRKPAVVNAGPDQIICSTSASSPLSGSVTAGGSTGVWSHNGSGNISPSNAALNGSYNVAFADITVGSVQFILTSTNNEVCPAVTDTARISIMLKPSISLLQDTTICSYQNPLHVTAGVSGGSGAYQWSTNGSGTFAFAGGLNTVYYTMSAADIASGFVKLSINSVNNGPCASLTSAINVIINPTPDAEFTASTFTANIPNDPIQFTNQSTGANSYYWNFGDGGFTNLTNPVHNYQVVGFYTVSLVATNQFGCMDTVQKPVKVISDIQFPNVFTPNANGGNGGGYNPADFSNDVFFPYTSGVTEYHLMIFNRWGELVFDSKDIAVGWDGYFNGKLCQQDAYVWKADVKFFDGRKFNKTGSVTLLR